MPQATSLAYLPDTARLEWAIDTVLHAPDAMPLDLARLTQLEEAKRGEVCFTPHPAVRLLQSDFPIDAIWRAVLSRDDGAMGAVDLNAGPVWLLIHRTPFGVEVDRLSAWQWRLAAALFAGRPLHAALEETPSSETYAWLATLLASGCFTAISLSDRPFD